MSENIDSTDNQLRNFLQEWWLLITTISTGIAGLLAGLISEGTSKIIGLIITLLTIGIAAFIWKKQKKKKTEKEKSKERVQGYITSTDTSSFRALYSFKIGDDLPGSDRRRQAKLIYTQIVDPDYKFGIICGESGCGKSSLINAGLIKLLNENNKKTIVFKKNKNNFAPENLPVILAKIKEDIVKNDTEKNQFLVIDQFEEFLIVWMEPKERQIIGKFFHEILQTNVKVVLGLRKDYLADISDFEPVFPNAISSKNIFYVKNFTLFEAKEIIEFCAIRDGLEPSEELIDTLVMDLTNDAYIRPVQLQIVCTALLANFDLNSYRANGGVKGILSSYVKDVIDLCQNTEIAKKTLRSLCDFSTKAKTQPKTIDTINKEIGENIDQKLIESHLEKLENSRIIIAFHEDELKKFSIVHDYLVDSINIATSDIATDQEKANQLLRYHLQNDEYGKANLTSKDLRFIKKNADGKLIESPKFDSLIKRHRKKSIIQKIAYSASVILICLLLTLSLAPKTYWKDIIIDFYGENIDPKSVVMYLNEKEKYIVTSNLETGLHYMWNIETGEKLYSMEGDNYTNFHNNYILTCSDDDTVSHLHNLLKKEKRTLPFKTRRFYYNSILGMDEQGNFLVVSNRLFEDSTSIWSFIDNKETFLSKCSVGFAPQHAAFDPSLTRVFITCMGHGDRLLSNNSIGVWNLKNGNFIKFLSTDDTAVIESFEVSEKADKVFTVEYKDTTAKLVSWDLASLNHIKDVSIKEGRIRISQNGEYIFVDKYPEGLLSKEKPQIFSTNTLLPYRGIDKINQNIIIGDYVIFNKQDSAITYISNVNDESIYSIDCNLSHLRQAPIIKSDSIIIFFNKNKSIQIWNYRRNSKNVLDKIQDIRSICLTLDGNLLQVNQGGNKVVLIDYLTNKIVAELLTIGSDTYNIYYNNECNHFIVWTGDGRILKYVKANSLFGKEFYSTNCKN